MGVDTVPEPTEGRCTRMQQATVCKRSVTTASQGQLGTALAGPSPALGGDVAHLLPAHVLRSEPVNNRGAFGFPFLPFLLGRL